MPRAKTGSIFTRKDRPGLWVKVPYEDETGQTRYLKRRVESSNKDRPPTKADARALIKKTMAEIEQKGSRIVDGDKLTFARLAEHYAAKKIVAPVYKDETKIAGLRSYKSQRSLLKSLVEHFGKRKIKAIRHEDLETYRLKRSSAVIGNQRRNQGRELKITSVNRELQLLRAMFNYAKRQGWLSVSPFELGEAVISSAQETRRDRVLSGEEERQLLAVCIGEREHLRALVIVAVDTGMRKGELLKITWLDVNFDLRLIGVRAMISKTARARRVGMTNRVFVELQRLRQLAPSSYDGPVFGLTDFKRSWNSATKKAELTDLRFHDLRHTAATRMIAAGRPVQEVMRILGHTTMAAFNGYSNLTDSAASKGAAALDGELSDLLQRLIERFPENNWEALLNRTYGVEIEPQRPDLIN